MSAGKKSTAAGAHQPAVQVGYRDDATARDHAGSLESNSFTVPVRSAQEFAPPVCRIATKAKPGRASKQLPILKSAFALCRGRKRKTSSLECRLPGRRPC